MSDEIIVIESSDDENDPIEEKDRNENDIEIDETVNSDEEGFDGISENNGNEGQNYDDDNNEVSLFEEETLSLYPNIDDGVLNSSMIDSSNTETNFNDSYASEFAVSYEKQKSKRKSKFGNKFHKNNTYNNQHNFNNNKSNNNKKNINSNKNNYNYNTNNNNNSKIGYNKEYQIFSVASFHKNDAIKTVTSILKHLTKEREFQPLNSWPLRLQYRFGSFFFFLVFVISWIGWYCTEEIYCINSYNAHEKVPFFIINICLSYPYVEKAETGERTFILYYRWVHYTFLVIALVLYLPRFVMKRFGSEKLRTLFAYLTKPPVSLGKGNHGEVIERITHYFEDNLGAHKGVYGLFLLNHFLSAFILCASIYLLDFVLQGRFLLLSFYSLLHNRDVEHFTDHLSSIFPPFVTCKIEQNSKMQNARNEEFNCHLTLMELYEKVFVFVWMYLLVAWSSLVVKCLVITLLPLPYVSRYFLKTCSKQGGKFKFLLYAELDFGDLFILFLIKGHLSESLYIKVLESMAKLVAKLKEQKKECEQKLNQMSVQKKSDAFLNEFFKCSNEKNEARDDFIPNPQIQEDTFRKNVQNTKANGLSYEKNEGREDFIPNPEIQDDASRKNVQNMKANGLISKDSGRKDYRKGNKRSKTVRFEGKNRCKAIEEFFEHH